MELVPPLLTPDSLPMPADRTNNFWYVPPTPASDVTIVFLHGIFSSSRTCWLHEGSEGAADQPVFWPDLVRADSRLGSPAIYLAGYDTAPDAGDLPIAQCVRQVFDAMQRPERDGTPPVIDADALIFVCHSLGGIMARYLIERNKELFRDKAVGLALMASPSLGSKWATLGSFAAKYYHHRLAQQLRWKGEALEELHGRFRDLVDRRATDMPGLFGMEAAETKMIFRDTAPGLLRWLLPNRQKVVEPLSAGQYFSDVALLPGTDHFSIVKPSAFSHPAHDFLVTFVGRFRKLAAETRANRTIAHSGAAALRATGPLPSLPAVAAQLAGDHRAVQGGTVLSAAVAQSGQNVVDLLQLTPAPGVPAAYSDGGAQAVELDANTSAAFAREGGPRPRLDELFEIITEPNDVVSALYRTASATAVAPYDAGYVNARQGVADMQQALEKALRESKGRLLVTGRQGIGKTREVAELARAACAKGWKVLVARDEGNARLGPPADLPAGWSDARVLIVVDNLHSRLLATADAASASYTDRLWQLLHWFEARLPGSVRLVSTARDEARFEAPLALSRDAERWRGLSVLRLPVLTNEALQYILTTFAGLAHVPLDVAVVPALVENSDKMPETMFINVDIARRERRGLDRERWNPIEGETWKLRFISVQAEHPAVERICQALRLLAQIGVPARVRYVTSIARDGLEQDPATAVNALVDERLLSERQSVLMPVSTDQIDEYLGKPEGQTAVLPYAEALAHAITDPANRPPEWVDDLLALMASLSRTGALDRAKQLASQAIDLGAGTRVHRARAAIQFQSGELVPAEADLTAAIDSGGDDIDTRFLRGLLRNLLGKFDDAFDDLATAVRLGRDDSIVHAQLATSYYQRKDWSEAEREFSLAIARDDSSGQLYFVRGVARLQNKDAAGAEQDLSAALERSVDFNDLAGQIRSIDAPGLGEPALPSLITRAASPHNSMVRLQRAVARLALNRFADAEADLTAAIDEDAAVQLNELADAVRGSRLPIMATAKDQLASLGGALGQGGPFQLRGMARLNQGKLAEAEADCTKAIDLGPGNAPLFTARANARIQQKKLAEAEADLTKALSYGSDGSTLFSRGCVRVELGLFEDAERDLTAAFDLGVALPALFSIRGLARLAQAKTEIAEEDATKAFELGADDVAGYSLRAALRLERKEYAGAEQDFTAAVQRGRQDAWLFYNRGRSLENLHRYAEAEQNYDRVVALGEADALVFFRRGGARIFQDKPELAAEDFAAAIRAGRDDAVVHGMLAQILSQLKRYREAEAEADLAIERDDSVQARQTRGHARLARARFEQAEEDYAKALEMESTDAESLYRRGMARFGLGNLHGALTDYDAAIARLPDNLAMRGSRVFLHTWLDDLDAASRDCAELERLDREDVETVGALGILDLARRDIDSALERFATAAQKDKVWLVSRGLACLIAGMPFDARQAYAEGVLAAVPGDVAFAINELDRHVEKTGRVATADARAAAALVRADLVRQMDTMDR